MHSTIYIYKWKRRILDSKIIYCKNRTGQSMPSTVESTY